MHMPKMILPLLALAAMPPLPDGTARHRREPVSPTAAEAAAHRRKRASRKAARQARRRNRG
jgi:hypothetical protein